MLNTEELRSCIQENLRQNQVYESLIKDLETSKCIKHGAAHMRVCPECHGIRCMHCNWQPCQCWNDE
jgi:hypothetical protein